MRDIINFQIQVATGRFTLPVVILICLILWGFTFQEWEDFGSLAIVAAIGYLMIETNTAFTMIRTRTTMPVCLYWFIASSLFFLHSLEWQDLVPLAFILSVFHLFRSYESSSPAIPVYHAFLFIGLGSLIFPPFIHFLPLWWGSMIPFRSMSGKSFLASIIGTITPYWFLFGYAFWFDQLPLFLAPLQGMADFSPIGYSHLSSPESVSWVTVTLLLLVSGGHYLHIAYTDKTRTRIYHTFLVVAGLWATLCCVLQPQHLHAFMPIQLICTSFLSGHLFTLTQNRFSGILFIVTFVALVALTFYNLWMQ